MPLGLLQRLDRLARNLTPLALSFLLVIISATPLRIPEFGPVAPNVALIAAYYWGIYRPDLFPLSAAFVVGLWQDVLVGTPLGMNALVLLAIHWFILSQRRFFQGKSFAVVWWAFALMAAAAAVLLWLISMAYHGRLLDATPAAFQGALTMALYPFLTWVFARAQHAVLRQA
jgi:rod shape-determining protein MreD